MRHRNGITPAKVAVALLVLLAVIALLIYASSPRSYGNDPNVIDRWEHEGSQTSPTLAYELTSAKAPRNNKLHHFTRRIRQGPTHQVLWRARVYVYCGKTMATVTGYNAIGQRLMWAEFWIHHCWGRRNGVSTNKFYDWRENHHCDAAWWTLWHCNGMVAGELVKGSGFSNKPGHRGVRYRYRRAYFEFERGFSGIAQHVKPFTSVTARADGSFQTDAGN